jgi:hypothetical protein
MGTPPAIADPASTRLPTRSLFATLLQTHNLWGQVARLVSADAMQLGLKAESRIDVNDYGRLSQVLLDFERDLPQQHSWSVWNLRAFKVEGLDLSFLSAVMILRLSNIILRRSYLHDILKPRNETIVVPTPTGQSIGTDAWSSVADQLYANMLRLHEQITAFFAYRSPDQGYPALIVFCVYVCGSLANHLHRQPQLCPHIAPRAMGILRSSIRGLADLQVAWPFAQRWYLTLRKATEDVSLEEDTPVVDRQTKTVSNTSAAHYRDNTGAVDVATFEGPFNDHFPSDAMTGAFDMYLWDGLARLDDQGLFEDLLTVPAGGDV